MTDSNERPNNTPASEGQTARRGRLTRRSLLQGAAALGAAGVAGPGMLSRSAFAQGMPKKGGKSTWAYPVDPVQLDPVASGRGSTWLSVYDTLYESLTRFDKNENVVPSLAVSWENPDPLKWIFHLRKGVKFHNGKEMTADDVVFWDETLHDPKGVAPLKSYFSSVDKVVALDDYTVEMRLNAPLGPMLRNLAQLYSSAIIPRDWKASVPDLSTHAMGTGPFKLKEYEPNSHMIFQRHEQYWDAPMPYLDEVTIRILPDEETRIGALRSGQIDYANISPDGVARLRNNPNLKVISTKSTHIVVHMINTRIPPFNDVRVRKAVNLAINRQEVIDKVVSGEGKITGPVPTGMGQFYIPEDQLGYHQDLAEAKRLLAEAGYPDGVEVNLVVRTTSPDHIATSVILAEQLRPLGIKVNIEQFDESAISSVVRGFKWNFYANAWSPRVDPDAYFGRTFLSTNPQNWMGWGDPDLDELIGKAREPGNEAERMPMYHQIQRRILDEVPVIYWYQANNIEVVNKRLAGYWGSFVGRRGGMRAAWIDA